MLTEIRFFDRTVIATVTRSRVCSNHSHTFLKLFNTSANLRYDSRKFVANYQWRFRKRMPATIHFHVRSTSYSQNILHDQFPRFCFRNWNIFYSQLSWPIEPNSQHSNRLNGTVGLDHEFSTITFPASSAIPATLNASLI